MVVHDPRPHLPLALVRAAGPPGGRAMKTYEEYLRSHDGWHEMVAQLHRDILVELERLRRNIDTEVMATLEMEMRIAKLEEAQEGEP